MPGPMPGLIPIGPIPIGPGMPGIGGIGPMKFICGTGAAGILANVVATFSGAG